MSETANGLLPESPSGNPQPRPRRLAVLLAIAFIIAFVTAPFWVLMLAFWAADGSWNFDSNNGFRYWLFVKGSRLERLGFVEQTGAPASYSISLQEGTFPGWSVLGYQSRALPTDIIAAYADRCRTMGLRVMDATTSPDTSSEDKLEASLECEIEPYINAEFFAERTAPSPTTRVSVRVWGSE